MLHPLIWKKDEACVALLDQTRLPVDEHWLQIESVEAMAEAIRALRVRGAPAIGIAAAYGVVLAVRGDEPLEVARRHAREAAGVLEKTRPTAVNLFWALRRMRRVAEAAATDAAGLKAALLAEAEAIFREDLEAGRLLGEQGLTLLKGGMSVMTHCHAGGVATAGYGTALAPFYRAGERGIALRAIVNETRPLLQGSRITAWELHRAGVPVTLITDSMAGHVMSRGRVDAVIVGADRIAANGDVANKIGTYGLAVLARAHGIPFYVSAPVSTFDPDIPDGNAIVIEERDANEVIRGFGRQTAPSDVEVYNPAFDVTPSSYIDALITERGVLRPPYAPAIRALFDRLPTT